MRLTYSADQELLRRISREVLAEIATVDNLTAAEESENGIDPVHWKRVIELGWLAVAVPESHGGSGATAAEIGILMEEIGRSGWASPLFETTVVALLLAGLDSRTSDADAFLRDIAAGSSATIVGIGPDRPAARADNGRLSLSGGPYPVPWAHFVDRHLVLFEIDSGLGIALLTPDRQGISVRHSRALDNEHLGMMTLDDVLLGPDEWTVLHTGEAIDAWLSWYRAPASARLLGTARKLLEMTLEYTKTRHQFGRPLASLPTVQQVCADMAIEIEGAELATYDALHRLDLGLNAAPSALVCSYMSGLAATNSAINAAQLHGAIGFMQEYHLQFFFRRAKAQQLEPGAIRHQDDAMARVLLPAVRSAGPAIALEGLVPRSSEREKRGD